jgi:beta-galactosidase/beta-glucuronidase
MSLCVVQVGFRHTCVAGGRLLHNGRPLLLKGVNRHEFDDVKGEAGRTACSVWCLSG